jgi:hypothetical protein
MKRMMLVALLGAALTGCGSTVDVAQEADHSSPAPTTPAPTTPSPTTGTYPDYPHGDYTYVLRISCFCADVGVPFEITVQDGKAVKVVYAKKGHGHRAGEVADLSWMQVTLADIIDAANDTQAAQVTVEWPAAQDYPTSVYVDQDRMMADEEIGYFVSDVVPTD